MRVAVLDVGSNTVRLVVADAEATAPLPLYTAKRRLRLAERVDGEGCLDPQAVVDLTEAVSAARAEAERLGVAEPFAFATSVLRRAPNNQVIRKDLEAAAGVHLHILPGGEEAELAFLAARHWLGWRAGPLALLDIGGGSLEVAFGRSRLPDLALSLPLGAARLTRELLREAGDPPDRAAIQAVRRRTRRQLHDIAARMRWERPRTVVATSRTFQQLARLCGAPPMRKGPFVPREMDRAELKGALRRLAALPAAERAELPGISSARAEQSLAGAVVAHTAMKMIGTRSVTICPWAVREGVMLRCLEEQTGRCGAQPKA